MVNKGWFNAPKDTLLNWHRRDPVDEVEVERSTQIRAVQGNLNQFALGESLVERVFQNQMIKMQNRAPMRHRGVD